MNVEYVGTSEDVADIVNCANNIVSTIKGTMPYARDMGISSEVIGRSNVQSKATFKDEAITQLQLYDERIHVKEISVQTGDDGVLIPEVVIDGE